MAAWVAEAGWAEARPSPRGDTLKVNLVNVLPKTTTILGQHPGLEGRGDHPEMGSATLLVPVMDWDGMTMFHCHIIEHEDIGMMGVWDIMGGM